MKILHAFDRALTTIVTAVLVLIFGVMLGLAALQVILRGGFQAGLLWGDVAARHLVIWVGFLGAFLATRENKHFHIDVLTRFLPAKIKLWFNAFSDLFAAVICYLLLNASLTFLNVGMDPEATSFLHIPQQTVAAIVPAGFGLIMIQFLIRMVESIVEALGGPREEGAA